MNTTVSLNKLKNHPWMEYKNGLYLVPVQYLIDISYTKTDPFTDLGEGDDSIYSNDVVWENILNEGMMHPLYVIVKSPNLRKNEKPTIRLEAGNHRVRMAFKNGLTHLPVAGVMQSNAIYAEGNGTHTYPLDINLYKNYLSEIGCRDTYYDLYPQPIDLKMLLPDLDIYYTNEIKPIEGDTKLLHFEKNINNYNEDIINDKNINNSVNTGVSYE